MNMYKKLTGALLVSLLGASVLCGCRRSGAETEAQTQAPVIQTQTDAQTQAPETQAPETQTQAPETQAPETQAPETEAPETEAPAAEIPETEAPALDDRGVSGTDTGEAVDLYRNDGTYVRLIRDENGNWADESGLTYILGEDGATDSNGEFHPW